MQQTGKTTPREDNKEWLTWSLALSSFAAVSLLAMVFLCQYAILIQTHYRVVALRDHQHTLDRERSLMQLQLQSLSSLERVEAVSPKNLKMIPPLQRDVLNLTKVQANRQVEPGPTAKN